MKDILSVTTSAAEQIHKTLVSSDFADPAVQITINPDRPVMEKYELEIVSAAGAGPPVQFKQQGITFVMNEQTAGLLAGTTMDFIHGMWRSGFRFENPNRLGLMAQPGLASRVMEVLKAQVNPEVAAHGGRVLLVDVRDNIAHIQLEGGCQGCSMAARTVDDGIRRTIRDHVPEILDVADVTRHAEGTSPYYA